MNRFFEKAKNFQNFVVESNPHRPPASSAPYADKSSPREEPLDCSTELQPVLAATTSLIGQKARTEVPVLQMTRR
jgi:hypothetical protein